MRDARRPEEWQRFVDLGGDNNRSSWKPGAGNDHVVGRGGRDSLFFLGSADGQADRVEVAGTDRVDALTVAGSRTTARLTGLSARSLRRRATASRSDPNPRSR